MVTLRIVYLTFDGVLQPLGESQVLAYLEPLASRGFAFTLISLEKPSELQEYGRVGQLRSRLEAQGIRWIAIPYKTASRFAMLRNLGVAFRKCWQLRRDTAAIHARSYPPAAIAWLLRRLYGTPYLFDMRGYWVDEKRVDGRAFLQPAIYSLAKRCERGMVRSAAGIATLTQLQADDVALWRRSAAMLPVVIPTCADFPRYSVAPPQPPAAATALRRKLILGFVGSVNRSYLIDETLRLFRRVHAIRPDSHLLAVTQQPSEIAAHINALHLEPTAFTVTVAAHDQMPALLAGMDWGFLLLRSDSSKRGSMPTKLAEFFASGVRPIFHGCNPEAASWVARSGSGILLETLDDAALDHAAQLIAQSAPRPAPRPEIVAHFGLEQGVRRYADLLTAVAVPNAA